MRISLGSSRPLWPDPPRRGPIVLVWTAIAIQTTLVVAGCAANSSPPQPDSTPTPQTTSRPKPDVALATSGKEKTTKQPRIPVYQRGEASYYGSTFQGRETASGESFDADKLTAAHRRLPLGTRVRITNVENGRSVVVRINDRGPYADGRILDLSRQAAKRLGMIEDGTTEVKLQLLKDR